MAGMHWRARIGTVDGAPRGAGVLVDSTRLITCAVFVSKTVNVGFDQPLLVMMMNRPSGDSTMLSGRSPT